MTQRGAPSLLAAEPGMRPGSDIAGGSQVFHTARSARDRCISGILLLKHTYMDCDCLMSHHAELLKVLNCEVAAGRGSTNRLWTGDAYPHLAFHICAAHGLTVVLNIPQV